MKRGIWFYVQETLGLLIGLPALLAILLVFLALSPIILLVWAFQRVFGE